MKPRLTLRKQTVEQTGSDEEGSVASSRRQARNVRSTASLPRVAKLGTVKYVEKLSSEFYPKLLIETESRVLENCKVEVIDPVRPNVRQRSRHIPESERRGVAETDVLNHSFSRF